MLLCLSLKTIITIINLFEERTFSGHLKQHMEVNIFCLAIQQLVINRHLTATSMECRFHSNLLKLCNINHPPGRQQLQFWPNQTQTNQNESIMCTWTSFQFSTQSALQLPSLKTSGCESQKQVNGPYSTSKSDWNQIQFIFQKQK